MDYHLLIPKIAEKMKKDPLKLIYYEDYIALNRELLNTDPDPSFALTNLKKLSEYLNDFVPSLITSNNLATAQEFMVLHRNTLKTLAPYDFDSYLLFVEWNREPRKKFYPPRRATLKPIVNSLQDLADDKLDILGISLPPGVGKALANNTPIPTRDGWKKHGDLRVGDEVIGMDGEFKKVIAVHPKCMLDCEIKFTNGETIVCHENHEWMVHDKLEKDPEKRIYTVETKLLESKCWGYGEEGKRGHRYRFHLPHRSPMVGEEKTLPVPPYALGAWLGDGNSYSPLIASPFEDRCVPERIMVEDVRLRRHFFHKDTNVLYCRFDMRKELRELGLCHSHKKIDKFIPDCYLRASISQRLDLLAGLIDTDGTRSGSKYLFSTTIPSLRDSFAELIATFGWRLSITSYEPRLSSSGVQGRKTVYVMGFTPDMYIPCEVERKRLKEVHKQRAVAFKSIRRIEPVEGNCITVEGDGMYLAGKTMIPTHNTTLAIFYLTWLAGKYPDAPMLTGSHSNSFVRGTYDECLRIFDPQGEYLWQEVFPDVHVTSTNAKDCRIDLGERKRFETLEFTSIGTGNAGLYRAATLLYCDDLVSGIEVALSKERLDKLWETYTTDLRQRKIGNICKELHIATRWSVHDVIGRLEEEYADNPKAKFIALSALNENDESNFNYPYGVGFSTSFYHEQREIMDDVNWRALYMNQPIEREGQLYAEEELQRYFTLPDGEPDAIISVCDTKDRGSDDCVMPIAYKYGDRYYIEEILCDNSNPELVDELLIDILLRHKVKMTCFESNSAGGRVAQTVQQGVKDRGGITKVETKYTTANKETKILVNSPWVKEHCVFKDDTVSDRQYKKAVGKLCAYTTAGKNKHDDVPDAFAQLAEYAENFGGAKIQIVKRPF